MRAPRVLVLCLTATLATTACRRSEDPAEGSAMQAAAPAEQAPVEASGDATDARLVVETTPPSAQREARTARLATLVARRPDARLAQVPGTATVFALVDGDAMAAFLRDGPLNLLGRDDEALTAGLTDALGRVLGDAALAARFEPLRAGGGVLGVTPDGWFMAGSPAAMRAPPAEGAQDIGVGDGSARAAVRDGVLRVWQGEAAQASRDQTWQGVVEQANAGAMVTIVVPSIAALSPETRASFAAVERAGAESVVLAIAPDGAIEVVLIGALESDVRMMLGRAQAFLSQSFGQLRGEAPPSWQGAVSYGVLVGDALMHTVRVHEVHGGAVISMEAPRCGSALNTLAAATAIAGIAHVAATAEGVRELPFVDTRGPIADGCGEAATPPQLGRRLAALAPADIGTPRIVVLADVAGLLRSELPTAFGVLPFALTNDAVADALGGAPFGMRGIGDQEGSGAWMVEPSTGDMTLIGWPGLPREGADGSPYAIGTMVPARTNPFGATWSTISFDAIGGLVTATPGHPWLGAAALLPRDAAVAVLLTGSMLTDGAPDALSTAFQTAGVVGVSWSPSLGWAVSLPAATVTDGDAVLAALPLRALALVESVQRHGPLTPDTARTVAGASERLAASSTWVRDGDAMHLVVDAGAGGALFEAALSVGLPAIGGALRHAGIDIPAPVLEVPLGTPR